MNALMRLSLLSVGLTASLAVLSPRTASAQEANGFGEKGELIVTADRLMPLIGYSRESVDSTQNGVTVTQSDSSTSIALLFGREPALTVNPHTIPRIAFDYVLAQHFTLGGSFVLGLGLGGTSKTETTQGGSNATQSTDAPTVTAVGVAFRAGYVLPLGQSIAFWPRAGLAGYSLSSKSTTTNNNQTSTTSNTDTAFSIDLDPQFVWVPIPHFFVHAGPLVNIPIAGKRSQTTDQGNSTVDVSNDLHIFHIGLSAGLGGWFDI